VLIKKICAVALVLIFSEVAFGSDCSQYIGKGYCTDYIKKMTGNSQPGDAKNWVSNISPSEVLPCDTAIFTNVGNFGHVAFVDAVSRDGDGRPISVNLSEWNYGSIFQDESCGVTNKFGITTVRTNIAVSLLSFV
jgi:surface antigen